VPSSPLLLLLLLLLSSLRLSSSSPLLLLLLLLSRSTDKARLAGAAAAKSRLLATSELRNRVRTSSARLLSRAARKHHIDAMYDVVEEGLRDSPPSPVDDPADEAGSVHVSREW